MQLINYIKILRPLNLLISALCVLLCAFILNQLSTGILPLMYTILLLAGFSNIINDIMDYKIDQKNQKIQLTFENNETFECDYLIISDGIFSKSKNLILNNKNQPKYDNTLAIRGMIPNSSKMSDKKDIRQSPHSIEAEKAVLGCMLLNKEAISKAVQLLVKDSFYNTAHQIIFER